MSKLEFFQLWSHIGRDWDFQAKSRESQGDWDGWTVSKQTGATASCIKNDTHLNQTLNTLTQDVNSYI